MLDITADEALAAPRKILAGQTPPLKNLTP
jgi:hypothetical protein